MFFDLTDDQRALQSAVRELISERFDLAAVREVYDDPAGAGDPPGLWEDMAKQGWPAVLVPEEHDGLGMGLLDAAVIARELGTGVVPGPYLSTVVAGEALRLAGSEQQRAQWLPKLAAGELKLALAGRRAGGGWDAGGLGITAAGGRLSGTAVHVEYAHVADRLVVAARGDGPGEVSFWLVDPAGPGVTITRHETLDRTTRVSTVGLDGAAGEALAEGSAAVLAQVYAIGAVLTANDLAGIAREALRRTVDYDQTRQQFGKPVGSFQAIKHHLADLHVAVTMAEHGGWYAAHAVAEGLPDATAAVSVAKAKASDAARDMTAAMIQYHGGIGYTWEHEAHFFFKRAKRLEYAYGDAGTHRERLAVLLIDRPA